MSMHTEWISFEQNGTKHRLYAARPERAKAPLPVVLVIQELWGTDDHILDLTERFARAGYLAVAPDLYAVGGQRPESLTEERIEQIKRFLDTLAPPAWHDPVAREAALEKQPEELREILRVTFTDLFAYLGKLPELLERIQAATAFLADHEWSRGQKIASIGFCMGGALSIMLAASEPKLAGAVNFYGRMPVSKEQVAAIQCPIRGFFGELDPKITSLVPEFEQAMSEANKSFTYNVYGGAHHGFLNDTRGGYHVEASRDAWKETIYFFHKVLS
ncbi:dienelactone hydrolase family protein [Brevibacillus invocatus]|uniref:dienelactone hydrolase family protein n=1 Tax=Brevibacillus invocatus TaxID=173959 RepID=UPI00203CCA43|nr:dienelactone hydrolase family protein [Brevibacillus invocatus]MCM3080590.1 dienelactone hydrolase family protein [Brevibacillus invocatus]MCM3430793.1 dienelactone hydrolase family protein [Brevibacillus invocatus]